MELVQTRYRGYKRRRQACALSRYSRTRLPRIHGLNRGPTLSEREQRPPGALAGIRVVDLTRILAGPFCTQLLADMGADVIKIETGRGDPVRGQGTMVAGESAYFAQFNRNKRSVVLDLYTNTDKDTLTALLKSADVVVENYRPGVFAEMGYTPEFLEQLNPQLIHGSVNGYGTSGPYVDRPSFDFIAQAMSCLLYTSPSPRDLSTSRMPSSA